MANDDEIRKVVKRIDGTPNEPQDRFGEVVLCFVKVGVVLFALATLYIAGPTIVEALIRATHAWQALLH
ncbi:MAG: hypothetical protein JWN43_320 [Gammaproteobacteria bacterium]|nr:hypothetical protein [Gammaproteobacteria bacterium]